MINIAQNNAKRANVDDIISFQQKNFLTSNFHTEENTRIITNPPYGKRIVASDLKSLYEEIYSSFDEKGFGGIITSFDQVKPNSEKRSAKPIFNGEDKCTFWTRKLN